MVDPGSSPPSLVDVLSIGPVELSVRSSSVSRAQHESAYLPFLLSSPSEASDRTRIDVEVVTEQAPHNRSSTLFETGGAWNMQAEDDGYRLNFHRLGSSVLHTVARSDSATTRVTVHVDQDELSADDQPTSAVSSPVTYPLDQLLLMNHMSSRGGVIVHGAGVVLDGRCILLAGVSGAGKSTIARLLTAAGLGRQLLSDDRIIISVGSGAGSPEGIWGWGTPWPGEAGVAKNEAAPLAAVVFLVKSDTEALRPLSPGQAAQKLARVASCPWYDAVRLPAVLETCSTVLGQVASYDLHFREDPAVVDVLVGHDWSADAPPAA